LQADERTLRQQIDLEVRRASLDVQRSAQSIDVSARAAQQAAENLALAEGRYETGVGNVIELTDAQVQKTSAEAEHVGALYDYQVAVAALEQAIGRELPSP
jgi:outer membrane protein TolC